MVAGCRETVSGHRRRVVFAHAGDAIHRHHRTPRPFRWRHTPACGRARPGAAATAAAIRSAAPVTHRSLFAVRGGGPLCDPPRRAPAGDRPMTRPTDAIVIGFTKNPELCRRAFEPLLDLRQQGVLRDIHYVTWNS